MTGAIIARHDSRFRISPATPWQSHSDILVHHLDSFDDLRLVGKDIDGEGQQPDVI